MEKADEDLYLFVCLTEKYFSIEAMTINIHFLLHICKSVYHWGPLWAQSCFPFETGNMYTVRAIKSANGINLQMVRYTNLHTTLLKLEKIILPDEPEIVLKFYENNVHKIKLKSEVIKNVSYFVGSDFSVDEIHCLTEYGLNIENLSSWNKMVKDECLYSTYLSNDPRTDNSFVELDDGTYVRVIKFIVNNQRNVDLTICHKINISNEVVTENATNIKKKYQV